MRELRAPWAKDRPILARRQPAVIAGVCRGLAQHLGGRVLWWRIAFVLGIIPVGLSVLVYVVLAAAMPRAAHGDIPVERSRLARRLSQLETRRIMTGQLALAGVLAASAVVVWIWMLGGFWDGAIVIPVLLLLAGAGVIWSASAQDEQPKPLQLIAGVLAIVIGAVLLVSSKMRPGEVIPGLIAGVAVLLAVGFVGAPLWIRTRTHLAEERDARIRESERADIAAHLHDSVLQTLALIRSRAGEPDVVESLARAQERDLRRYLYSDRPEEGTSAAEGIRTLAGEIEELYRHPIDVVITGDAAPGAEVTALIGAVGEALTNACKHGGNGPISLYAELQERSAEAWVRDRGPGFDPEQIPTDRAGIRCSIIERLHRVGGEAEIRSPLPAGGAEVRMSVPIEGKDS